MMSITMTREEAAMTQADGLQDVLQHGTHDEVLRALNALQQQVIEAILANDWAQFTALGVQINRLLGPLPAPSASEPVAQEYIAGRLSALRDVLRDVLRSLRELRASPRELQNAMKSRLGRRVMAVLLAKRSLCASELAEAVEASDAAQLSKVGKMLEDAGLITRESIGKYVRYSLTARGTVVARDLAEREGQSEQPAASFAQQSAPTVYNPVDEPSLRRIIREEIREALQELSHASNPEEQPPIEARDRLVSILESSNIRASRLENIEFVRRGLGLWRRTPVWSESERIVSLLNDWKDANEEPASRSISNIPLWYFAGRQVK